MLATKIRNCGPGRGLTSHRLDPETLTRGGRIPTSRPLRATKRLEMQTTTVFRYGWTSVSREVCRFWPGTLGPKRSRIHRAPRLAPLYPTCRTITTDVQTVAFGPRTHVIALHSVQYTSFRLA